VTITLDTPLCRDLGMEYPIFSAVSGAGGCGVLGGVGVPAVEHRRRIDLVRDLTDRPFGVNVVIADFEDPQSPEEDRAFVREQIEATVEAGVAVLVLFWGLPPSSSMGPTAAGSRSSSRSARLPRQRRLRRPTSMR
jgi:NAD(P)H-dependent flavin oxidoreductase YrpB (nitropropane dioxygenase family)